MTINISAVLAFLFRAVGTRHVKRNRALDRAFATIDECEYEFGVADSVSREDLYGRR